MKKLLYLTHRMPYPPNKGDKIRSFHILKHLAESYKIYLGTFVDDPNDWQYLPELEVWCEDVCCLPLKPTTAKLRSLQGLWQGQALTVPYYRDARMQQWVDTTLASQSFDNCLVFSSAMAQYVEPHAGIRKLIDFVDVDSDKWLQYARGKRWPLNWVYRREGKRLLSYDRRVADQFDHCFFVSEQEVALFRDLAPEAHAHTSFFSCGVDTDYFDPAHPLPSPYRSDENVLVFTGAMDYWANIDAVSWFAQSVFPQIKQQHAQARFYIVGSRPGDPVQALAQQGGVTVTGAVEDVRPYLQHACLAVAPMRIARGIQNKVLEALAMAKPVLVSTRGIEGISVHPDLDVFVADDPQELACQALTLLTHAAPENRSAKNRRHVQQHYTWQAHIQKIKRHLEHAG